MRQGSVHWIMNASEEEKFFKLVQSGSITEIFRTIYTKKIQGSLLNSALMRLVKETSGCNLTVVYELLRHGADVNQVDESHRTPLHYSVSNPNLIELLLHFNASITSLDSNNDSVLHSAARSGDPLSLSFLLVKVFIDSPDLMEARNKQKSKFYDLFRSRDQVLVYNRFKELKGLKLKPRTPSSNQNELYQQDAIKALMVLNDVSTLRRLKLERFSQEVNLPLCISEQVKRLIYKSKPPRKRGRSRTVKFVTRLELECQFLSKFAKIPSSVNLETILQSEVFPNSIIWSIIWVVQKMKIHSIFLITLAVCSMRSRSSRL